jgi:hypothetical protein
MNVQLFQALMGKLLERHYGIAITDTPFACETFVASRIKDGESVFACADGHAYKHDLERTDKHGPFGTPYYNSITPAEYFAALAEVGGQQDMGDDPITCPKCGRRTDFGYATFPVSQHHRCPASENECGHEFVVSLEDAPADG